MALRNIVQDTDPKIRKKSKKVTDFDKDLRELLDDMKETMENASGLGIAAIQVGVLKRAFIINHNNMFIEFVNPEIIEKSGKQENVEGCLSIKKHTGLVERPNKVKVKAYDRYKNKFELTVEGFMAAAICHEYDHLEGVLLTDKALELYDLEEE